jgi:carbamoyl-phosphate synthase large subunit
VSAGDRPARVSPAAHSGQGTAGDRTSPVTVVITAAGSAPAQAFIRGLRAQEQLPVRLVGLDTSPRAAGLFDCDRRYTIPRVADPDFAAAIAAVCQAEAADLLVPIADFELSPLAELAAWLHEQTGVRVITNTPQAVALANDKRASAEAVAAHGVAVPAVLEPSALQTLTEPVIVKPVIGAGSRGVTVVHDPAELAGALAVAGRDPIVQTFIDGPEHTVDMVIAPDGEVLALAPRVRVEVRAGQSYKSVTVDDPEVEEAARRVVAALGITAQANVQLIKSQRDGRPYFVECNPKFAAAMGLTIGAGLNVPLLYVKLALGLPVAATELHRPAGMWLLRSWQDRVVPAAELDAVPSWRDATSAA